MAALGCLGAALRPVRATLGPRADPHRLTLELAASSAKPGHAVQGEVVLALSAATAASRLTVELCGNEWVGFEERGALLHSQNAFLRTIVQASQEVWVGYDLPSGTHRFAFAFDLPADAPGSCTAESAGSIAYKLTARLHAPDAARDKHGLLLARAEARVFVQSFAPPAYLKPWESQVHDMKNQRVGLCLALPKLAFEPGELIDLHYQLTRLRANTDVKYAKVWVKRSLRLRAPVKNAGALPQRAAPSTEAYRTFELVPAKRFQLSKEPGDRLLGRVQLRISPGAQQSTSTKNISTKDTLCFCLEDSLKREVMEPLHATTIKIGYAPPPPPAQEQEAAPEEQQGEIRPAVDSPAPAEKVFEEHGFAADGTLDTARLALRIRPDQVKDWDGSQPYFTIIQARKQRSWGQFLGFTPLLDDAVSLAALAARPWHAGSKPVPAAA